MQNYILFILALLILFILRYLFFFNNKNNEDIPYEIINIKMEFTNLYLISVNGEYILIDTGYEKEFNKFIKLINEYKIEIGKIKYILLTHHHDDHVGFLNQLIKMNSNIKVILHRKTINLIAMGFNDRNNGGGIINKRIFLLFKIKQLLSPKWDLSFPPYKLRKGDIVLEEDYEDLSEILGVNIKALYTKGHSSDSVSYIYKDKYVFCGDLASNFLNWAGSKHMTLFNEDIDSVYKSWKKLMDLKVNIIIPSHGKPFNITRLKKNLNYYKKENQINFF